ncbi:hypothetical protein OHA25_42725 [Nonomuraea sp. NBC_00507]|uniref:citrate/2-methylcitrate synthase n=1 Tax=Nonomuraea sp. NBC_00507 TaxID=2976002 RepID=UPI002E1815BC
MRAPLETEELIAPVPMNVDGATAVVYAELGFPAPLARGLFVLSRSVGILAHASAADRLQSAADHDGQVEAIASAAGRWAGRAGSWAG